MSSELAAAMLRYTERQTGVSPFFTPIARLAILRSDHPKPPVHRMARPTICIVAQGAKWATFGGNRFEYRAGEALVVGLETPTVGCVTQASPNAPCLVLVFELDQAIMRSVAEDLDERPKVVSEVSCGVFVTNFRGPIEDCALRLVRLLDTPQAIPAIYPMIMREICYWLLTGPNGGDVARIVLSNSPSQRLIDAMHHLRDRYRESVRVADLAGIARLSPSAFHRQFKALTSLTPLQYQKQIRLLEARRLMVSEGLNVEAAAFAVGYESPSQFNREYARMFGQPPKRDVTRIALSPVDETQAKDAKGVAQKAA